MKKKEIKYWQIDFANDIGILCPVIVKTLHYQKAVDFVKKKFGISRMHGYCAASPETLEMVRASGQKIYNLMKKKDSKNKKRKAKIPCTDGSVTLYY